MMKKAVIITPFDNYSYNVRIKYLEQYLKEDGYDSIVISSDFDHRNKCRYDAKRENLELLHVPQYKKNLSFLRIYSHYRFAKSVYKRLKEISPDFVYCSAPPNFLFKYTAGYKRKNKSAKLIFEIGDLWPETMPLNTRLKQIFKIPLGIWANLRNRNMKFADYIIYECDLFRNILSKYHANVKAETIYLAKDNFYKTAEPEYPQPDDFNVAYVGSINNIVDIDGIVMILAKLSESRSVKFHIIGDGENKKALLDNCRKSGIPYTDYGVIYDDTKKKEILEKCQFGLNIMKSSVVVGATMKSLEYFHWGLILINNILADTENIISEYGCGFTIFHIDEKNLNEMADRISKLDKSKLLQMRKNSRKAYCRLFDERIIHQEYMAILDRLED